MRTVSGTVLAVFVVLALAALGFALYRANTDTQAGYPRPTADGPSPSALTSVG